MDVWGLVLVLGLLESPCLCQGHGRHPLPVLWIMPLTEETGRSNITAEVLPAVQLALHHLSKQPAPLGNYKLDLHFVDSKCDNAKALKAFFDAMYHGPKYFMVFGGVCPSITSTIAQSLEEWNLVQLSFATTAPTLANKRKYPNFFRTVPSDSVVNPGVVRFLRHYGWSRVATLTKDDPKFSEVRADLIELLKNADIQTASAEAFSHDPCSSVKKLKDHDVRIVIGQFDARSAVKVFCCAYKLDMFGRKHQWIIPTWYQDRWWSDTSSTNCTTQNVLAALEGSISVGIETLSSSSVRGISGRTPQEYEQEYELRRRQKGLGFSRFHGFAYDGVWVVAKALTRVMEVLRYRDRYNLHRNLTTSEREVGQMIWEAMDETQFFGVTGQVKFQKGERVGTVIFSQYQDGREVKVGEYGASADKLKFTNIVKFKGAEPPKDRTIVHFQRRRISLIHYSTLTLVTILCMITASALLFVIIKCRRYWIMDVSSACLDSLVILGSLLSYSFIIVFGLDGSLVSDNVFETLCSVRSWILTVGFTMTFGPLFARTWSNYVYMRKKVLPNQILTVCCVLLVDLCILICWQVLDPLRRRVEEHSSEADPDGRDFAIRPFLECCESMHLSMWLTAVYAHKTLLLFFGCFLAWEMRHVRIPGLNDSRYINLSMCNVGIMSILGLVLAELTRDQPNAQFCTMALIIIICNTSTLGLLFVPKLIILRTDPDKCFQFTQNQMGKKRESEIEKEVTDDSDDSGDSSSEISETPVSPSHLDALQSENQRLIMQLSELDHELEDITMQLQDTDELSHPAAQERFVENLINVGSSADVSGKEKCRTLPAGSSANWDLMDDINSPELIQRRLSLQLPILHHAYLLSIGGLDASCTSPVDSPCASPQYRSVPSSHRVMVTGV
ncbi:gamma-aminobutyric acid type B receptor subunit 2-like [Chanos chanos]|uniref:Gamma-aminobutyric acid type B receptor subunit 2-like n=1 Tax=Chanos chanos TaxID=29144 RepID=A0A6J2W4R9_CHACN|nr:gamma-aminobutyric acid type B receptor subunit 2-like [Chanos chanos]